MHIVFSQGILTNVYFLSGYTFSRIPNFQGIHLLIIMIVSTISKGLYKFLIAFFVNAEKYDFRVILNDPEFLGKLLCKFLALVVRRFYAENPSSHL